MRTGQLLVTQDGPDGAVREAEVLAVLGANAGPPFLVRWLDSGRTGLLYPDGDVWAGPRPRPQVPVQWGNRCG